MSAPSTLLDVLRCTAEEAPGCPIIHVRRNGSEVRSSHAGLLSAAERVARGLLDAGIPRRSPVLLVLDQSDNFQAAFWGALIAGLVPVPLAPEAERLRAVWSFLDRPATIVEPPIAERLPAWLGVAPENVRALAIAELLQAEPVAAWRPAAPGDLAYLQFSSGSTGAPKGVELTHGNVTANLAQILAASATDPADTFVTWLPYFHDMGLVATHLIPLAGQAAQIKMGPLHFAKRPLAWLEAASRHKATILSTANFALGLTLRLVKPEQLAGIDLSAVRLVTIGSEPISPELCRRFAALLAPCGLRPGALAPGYGLAEATVGVTLAPLNEGIRTHSINRAEMAASGAVAPVMPGPDAVELVDLGLPLPGCEVRIVDERDEVVDEAVVGDVQVRGPNVTAGYHHRADNTALFCGDWLRTGDRGFLLGGRLTVTGRAKDVLFVNGRKFHAADLEEVIGRVPGVRPRKVAVVGRRDRDTGGERIAVFVATEASALEDALPALRAVSAAAQETLGAAG